MILRWPASRLDGEEASTIGWPERRRRRAVKLPGKHRRRESDGSQGEQLRVGELLTEGTHHHQLVLAYTDHTVRAAQLPLLAQRSTVDRRCPHQPPPLPGTDVSRASGNYIWHVGENTSSSAHLCDCQKCRLLHGMLSS